MVKAIWVPSGDQRMPPGDSVRLVIWLGSEQKSSNHRTKIWEPLGTPSVT